MNNDTVQQTNNTVNSTASLKCEIPTQGDYIWQTAFLVLIMVVTLFGNFLVCLIVYLHHRLRTITNYFVVSLAVSDLLVAAFSLPFRIHQTLHNGTWCLGYELCLTWILTDLICSCASICNLAAISVDRYIAIVHPFRYHSLMTSKTGFVTIALVWIYSIVWAALSTFNWTDFDEQHILTQTFCRKLDKIFYTVVTVMDFYLPLLIVLVMYGFVFRVAWNQARAVATLQPVINSDRRGRRFSINLVKEVKAAKTLAIVIGAFVVCWFPFFTLLLVSLWNTRLLQVPQISAETLKGLRGTFLYVLPAINSTLNPIIYALFNRDFRGAFCRLFRRLFVMQSNDSDEHNASNADDTYTMATTYTDSPKSKKNGLPTRKTRFHGAHKTKRYSGVCGTEGQEV